MKINNSSISITITVKFKADERGKHLPVDMAA